MKSAIVILVAVYLSTVNGQVCYGKFNESIIGQCTQATQCEGTLLAGELCETRPCCVNKTTVPNRNSCFNQTAFLTLYNSSRGEYLYKILNYGMNQAGICANCHAKAAFLAVAAAMTMNFEKDEATGTERFFALDDLRYGNTKAGDGSRFRRRGLFGVRGRTIYERLHNRFPSYNLLNISENAAIIENSIEIAVTLWKNPTLQQALDLTLYADGTFYSFSQLWYKLTGGIEQIHNGAIYYSQFLRLLQCGGDLYPGQGPQCTYNETHKGYCTPDCIRGLEESGEFCGCSGDKGPVCDNSPPHIRCCLGSCVQELKMDLGLVIDASGSIGSANYELQRLFVNDLLGRVNVGSNRTHVGVVKYSTAAEILTKLNIDYELDAKLRRINAAVYTGGNTNTAAALQEANKIFSKENGLRPVEEGVSPLIFVITDGASADEQATLREANKLKQKNIHLVSVGVGDSLRYSELYGLCTPPASENYFAISNYAALEKKLNQFTAKSCSEPVIVPANSTVTTDVTHGKYKFLKIKIIITGKKIMIKIKLFNGKVKLFFSFKSRNPKDPKDFEDYEDSKHNPLPSLFGRVKDNINQIFNARKETDEFVTAVFDKPDDDTDFVYVGVKGVEQQNRFEVKLEDCAVVDCRSVASFVTMKLNIFLMVLFALIYKNIF